MVHRNAPPDRREATTIPVKHVWSPGSMQEVVEEFTVTYNSLPNGHVLEVFYNHEGSGLQSNEFRGQFRREACILISMLLQHGVPLEHIRAGLGYYAHNSMGTQSVVAHTIFGTIVEELAKVEGLDPVQPPPDVLQ